MHLRLWSFVFAVFATTVLAVPASTLASGAPYSSRATYTNPIKPGGGADPWVLKHGDCYYLTYTTGSDVQVTRSQNLAKWAPSGAIVYTPPAPYTDLWAPELHHIQGAFYIYVAIAKNGDNAEHRMYVLKGRSTSDPTQPFDMVGQLTSPDNNWAIDGTVLTYGNGRLYFIWSGWSSAADPLNQYMYIASMSSPTKISSERVLLHEPTLEWQRSNGQGVNEGPQILVHKGRTFLVYSAAGSWGQDYCLAIMGIDNGADPLVRSNWWVNDDGPIFQKSDAAWSTGHASFTADHKGVPYIVYHATQIPDGGWANRTIRAQSFKWNADGTPKFPVPVGFDARLPLPA